jgi:large subunit ribosomal protein L6
MSRIGKQPIPIPGGVEVKADKSGTVSVKGPLGNLTMTARPEIDVKVEDKQVVCEPNGSGPARAASAYHGMTRALINNMVTGVSKGFEKKLEIVGVGWNAAAQPKQIVLNIGFCHPVNIPLPQGITAECPNPTTIIIKGSDRQVVGQVAAQTRKVRPPEPYKGKGIRYSGEFVRRKTGKSFGS